MRSLLSPRLRRALSYCAKCLRQCSKRKRLASVGLICAVLYLYLTSWKPVDTVSEDTITPQDMVGMCTMIISGYSRIATLSALTVHYAHMHVFQEIIVSWGRTDKQPSSILHNTIVRHRVSHKVIVRHEVEDDLNLRFKLPKTKTDCVFISDDDIMVSESNVLLMYSKWLIEQNRIVGVFPRSHRFLHSHEAIEYVSKPTEDFSIVLTKFMLLHQSFLHNYFRESLAHVRAFVQERQNCEDIAINAMVSNITDLPPIYVQVRDKIDYGTGSGLYLRTSHQGQRHECMKFMCNAFGRCPFRHSRIAIVIFSGDEFVHAGIDPDGQIRSYLHHDSGNSQSLRQCLKSVV